MLSAYERIYATQPHFTAEECRGTRSLNCRSLLSISCILLLVFLAFLSTAPSKARTVSAAALYLGAWQIPGRTEPHCPVREQDSSLSVHLGKAQWTWWSCCPRKANTSFWGWLRGNTKLAAWMPSRISWAEGWLSLVLWSTELSYKVAAAAAAPAKSLQLYLTLCDPIDSSPLGSSVPGILQARILEWVAISFSNAWKWELKVKSLSGARLLATPWTAAHQAPPSMGFSRHEYWSGLPLPSPVVRLDG